jgi:hypothetical protein
MRLRSISILAALTSFLALSPSFGSPYPNPFRDHPLVRQPGQPDNPFPEDPIDPAVKSKLDSLLAAKDWKGISAATAIGANPNDFVNSISWLKLKTDTGGSFFIAMLYTRGLWQVADATKAKGTTELAQLMSLYTIALIHIDGMACGDPTAPMHRLDQMSANEIGAALRSLRALPKEKTEILVRQAVGLEWATADRRISQDDVVCSGGLDEIKAGIDANLLGPAHTEAGQIGKVIDVRTPTGWKPAFLQETIFKPEQEKRRGADLYDYLWSLLE